MRLFLALPVPASLRDWLWSLSLPLAEAEWVDPDSYHVTLRFLGEVSRPDARDLDEGLAALRLEALDLRIGGFGLFTTGERLRTYWAAVEPVAPIQALARRLDRPIREAGLQTEDRKLVPHVTLARLGRSGEADLAALLERPESGQSMGFRADRVVLYESRRGNGFVHYEPLAEYPMRD